MNLTIYFIHSDFSSDGVSLVKPWDGRTIYGEGHVVLPEGYTVEDTYEGPCVYNDKDHPCQLYSSNNSVVLCASQDGIRALRKAPRDALTFNLLNARLNADLTQQQLADACGMNVRQIQKVESGECKLENLAAKNFMAIADALNVDPHDII